MKIIKKAPNFDKQRFECDSCTTVWECDESEYKQKLFNGERKINATKKPGWFSGIDYYEDIYSVWTVISKCPICERKITVKVEGTEKIIKAKPHYSFDM